MKRSNRLGLRLAVLVFVLLALLPPVGAPLAAAAPAGARTVRDAYGVAHIYAENSYDLFFAAGYATAEDRLAQLDLFRRAATGRLAEALGPEMVESDIDVRVTHYSAAERAAVFGALPRAQQEILEAYRDGINTRLKEVLADPALLPYDFIAQGTTPELWTVSDSIAVLQFMARRFGEFGGAAGYELSNQNLYQRLTATYGRAGGEAIFGDVVWLDDPAAPTTVAASNALIAAQAAAVPDAVGTTLEVDRSLLEDLPARQERVRAARESIGVPTKLGSYAWAVDAAHSSTGNAMLFGGPQMGHMQPNIAYEIGLHGAGFDVVGMAFVGAPGILIGHNGRLSWSVTSGFGDQVDVYVELLHPTDPNRYWYQGAWHTMTVRTETIQIAGEAPQVIEVARTVHGPVVARDEGSGIALSERRAHWEREMDAWDTLLRFVQTQTVAEAMTVAAELPLSFNFVLADQGGHIGYRQTGRQPVRAPGYDRRLPLPGQGQAEWQGYLEPAAMPHVLDPQDGLLGNWNNKPAAGWVNGDPVNWGVVDRVDRVLDLLHGAETLTPAQVKAIAHDIGRHDYRADFLLPYLFDALAAPGAPTDPRLGDAEQLLRAWDHRADDGSIGETIFNAWRVRVFRDVLADELGDFLGPLEDPFNPTGDSLLLRSLQGPSAALPVARDYFNGIDPQAALVGGLIAALDDLTAQFGAADMHQWGWDPGVIEFTFGPFTFGQVPWHSRGSYMQFIEMSRPWVRGENVLPPGNSGTLLLDGDGLLQLDPHFLDQLDLYRDWLYKPMPLRFYPVLSYLPAFVK